MMAIAVVVMLGPLRPSFWAVRRPGPTPPVLIWETRSDGQRGFYLGRSDTDDHPWGGLGDDREPGAGA